VQDETTPVSPSADRAPITRSYTLPLGSGPNELRAQAYNANDSMQSNAATVSIIANLPPAPRGTLHAVVVGIQEFKNPRNNLKYSVSDANLFADTLRKYSAPLFENMDIKLLTTPDDTSRDHVMQTLKDMQARVAPDDVFVFYAASHGMIADDGEYYLITSNVESGATDVLKREALSQAELAALLVNIAASKKLVIIDTCQAQPLGDALQQALQTRGMNVSTAAKIAARDIGVTVLAAATTDEEALEGYKEHGLFSYAVTDGLAGKADLLKRGVITNADLSAYVQDVIPELAENLYQHEQTPTADVSGARFFVSKVK
jgi:uncharacterized caspase-like protein